MNSKVHSTAGKDFQKQNLIDDYGACRFTENDRPGIHGLFRHMKLKEFQVTSTVPLTQVNESRKSSNQKKMLES